MWYACLKCEFYTYKYEDIFIKILNEEKCYDTSGTVKVLEYSENSARIYLVSEKYKYGTVLDYKKMNGIFTRVNDKVIWSRGSADDFVWPYIR